MSTARLIWNEVRPIPVALRHSWRHHRQTGAALADLALVSQWRPGTCADHGEPLLVSFTKFTPLHTRDLADIWLSGIRLADQLIHLPGSVGVSTWIRPARRCELGSLSVWTDSSSLEAFITLPDHIAIMNKYRPRGLPVRSATWWTAQPHANIHEAISQGLELLDTHEGQRITLP